MKFILTTIIILLLSTSMTINAQEGLISLKSNHSVAVTADHFENLVKEKGLKFFMRIDHADNAANADLELRPTQVILFGNPKAGTPLMQCAQTTAIDLPQKALIWEDENADVWLSYNDPQYLRNRHAIEGCDPVLEKISGLLNGLAIGATSE